jgi:DNA-binding NtrC family response regulator
MKGKFREDLYYRLNTVPIYVPPLRERGNDIDLIFRKFASDFAEKYKTQGIRLNDDAKQVLLAYNFPGNIRQLKNLVEQMSVLETNREISAEQLRKYLPIEKTLPTVSSRNKSNDDFTERDLLYKILFDMKKDMNDLKKLVYEALQNETYGNQIIQQNQELFQTISSDEPLLSPSNPYFIKNQPLKPLQETRENKSVSIPIELLNDSIHEVEESLSLEEKEKEMILKALKKHNNKRKYAAMDLGISERTLYRKLKFYNIEE